MTCRGVHFALTKTQLARVLSAKTDDELIEVIQNEIETEWDKEWLRETDKAWDAIHRCLTDGKLGYSNGSFPLNACILGGEQLHSGKDYIVSLVRPEEVASVASALEVISEEDFKRRYFNINQDEYDGEIEEEDFQYTWEWFQDLPSLFRLAADNGRAILFTVDQ